MTMWFLLNSLLLISAIFKLMFFLRINQTFGMLVQLILQVVIDFRHFGFFMVCWILIFSFLYRIAGIDVPNTGDDAEYPEVNNFILFIIQIFRNSIGDLKVPDYTFWNARMTESRVVSLVMIAYVWFLWLINIMLMLIILLNFLIAIVSQSYDSVMTKSVQVIYDSRAEFAGECELLLSIFRTKVDAKASTFALRSNPEPAEESNEFSGFVKAIKIYVKSELN
jgi:hypothetical protein